MRTTQAVMLQIAAQVLAYMNSCVNPILYAFLSENFRRAFRRVILCEVEHRNQGNATQQGNHNPAAISSAPPPTTTALSPSVGKPTASMMTMIGSTPVDCETVFGSDINANAITTTLMKTSNGMDGSSMADDDSENAEAGEPSIEMHAVGLAGQTSRCSSAIQVCHL